MTRLSYNEAFDPYHAVFRFFSLHLGCPLDDQLPFDTLRILDFYLLFPFRLQDMKFRAEDIGWRQVSKAYADKAPYGEMPEDTTVFAMMEPFQRAAATSMALKGYLSHSDWKSNQITFTDQDVPSDLAHRCQRKLSETGDVVQILFEISQKYKLTGRDGLKDRTGLLEFRYDSL